MSGILRTVIILAILLSSSCTETSKQNTSTVSPTDFEESTEVNATVDGDFEFTLWAPGPLLSNAVSLSFGPNGKAYVSETARRKSSDIDIREHPNWMISDLAIQSIEESKAFHQNTLSKSKSDDNFWLTDFNKDGSRDYLDLSVQSERVRMIQDLDADGRADESSILTEGFDGMLTGVAAGILHFDNNIFLTAAPDLWKIKLDKSGRVEHKVSISHGYGHHIAYAGHDMSGLTIGPDGKIYWSIGDMGVNTIDQNGVRWTYPHEGAIMRCNPDGSDFEVFAHGLRNPQEIAFNQYGDLITVDNDGDHAGEHERYVHVLEGSDSGWRIYWQYGKYHLPNESYKVWTDEHLHKVTHPEQPAYLLPPLALAPDGPCGLAFNPGAALGEEWNDAFFASYFTGSSANSKVEAFWLEPHLSSYTVASSKQVVGGIVPTGIEFSPNGDLYVIDWKDGYELKPEGRIWKMSPKNKQIKKRQTDLASLLNLEWHNLIEDSLVNLLGHHDMRVRMQAQFEIVRRNEPTIFEDLLARSASTIEMIHSIWGLGQLGRTSGYDCSKLLLTLKEDNAEVRAQSAKVLGENLYRDAADDLIIAINDSSPKVVRHAIEALGKLKFQKAFDPIINYIESNGLIDPAMRHTIALSLSRLDSSESKLGQLHNHSNDNIRLSAILALRHLHSAHLVDFLNDPIAKLSAESAIAIHDDISIPAALPQLAMSLNRTNHTNEAFLRRAINANLRIHNEESMHRLKAFAMDNKRDEAMRREAIISLGYWNKPPLLDRVEGRYRPIKIVSPSSNLEHMLVELLRHNEITRSNNLLEHVIQACAKTNSTGAAQDIIDLMQLKNKSQAIQQAGLEALAQMQHPSLTNVFEQIIQNSETRPAAFESLGSPTIPDSTRTRMVELVLQSDNYLGQQRAILSLPSLQHGAHILKPLILQYKNNQLDSRLILEVKEAAKAIQDSELDQILQSIEGSDTSSFSGYLEGGIAERGKQLFLNNPTMPCTQCHIISGRGGSAGPDLTNIGSTLSRKELLESMTDPDARIAPGYGLVIVHLATEEVVTGFLHEHSEKGITLMDALGQIQFIEKNKIERHEIMPSSMLPAAEVLTPRELRDLVEYLFSLK